jgi:hypothetical protein
MAEGGGLRAGDVRGVSSGVVRSSDFEANLLSGPLLGAGFAFFEGLTVGR